MLLTILQFASFSAIAQVYNDDGSEAYDKKDYSSAVYFFTEGIKVNCKDKDLMAELYSNRAHAYLCLGEAFCIFQDLEVFILVGLQLIAIRCFACSKLSLLFWYKNEHNVLFDRLTWPADKTRQYFIWSLIPAWFVNVFLMIQNYKIY